MELRGGIVEEDSCKTQGRGEWGDGDEISLYKSMKLPNNKTSLRK